MRSWNFKKEPNYKAYVSYLFFVLTVCLVVFFIIGCTANSLEPRPKDRGVSLECRDGHLYNVAPQRVELIEQDGCVSGKVELKNERD